MCYDNYEREVQITATDDGVVIDQLLNFNRKLANTAKCYRQRYEDSQLEIGKIEHDCEQRVNRVRNYYKQILFSNDHSSVILRKSMESHRH